MKTLALSIGINKYDDSSIPELKNAENDAKCMNDVFKRLGFDTIIATDVITKDFREKVDEFIDLLPNYEVAIFFFAGHGFQYEGINYLCSKDLNKTNKTRIQYTTVRIDYLIQQLQESPVLTKIIILDACREEIKFEEDINRSLIIQNGFAPIYSPIGTFIAFSTSPGKTAKDGNGNNGLFTASLLKHIETKDISIEEVFKRTRSSLFTASDGEQISWEHTSLMGDYCFAPSVSSNSTSYSKTALADYDFDYTQDTEIMKIIKDLKSLNWYTQNPAIINLKHLKYENQSIDTLFVLGRNIYQTACGYAREMNTYFNNLKTNLMNIPEEARIHIVNGMVYEVYFDCHNSLRKEFKTERFQELQSILLDPVFILSADFISNKISCYGYRVIFDYISRNTLPIDLYFESKDDLYCLTGIYISGVNKMYDLTGNKFYTLEEEWMLLRDKDYIEKDICKKIAANHESIIFNYCKVPENITKFGYDSDYQLLNYQLH